MQVLTLVTRQLVLKGLMSFAAIALVTGLNAGAASAQTKATKAASPKKTPAPSITLTTKPTPPVAGDSTLTVTATDADGKPIVGADVTVEFVMAAMPSMGMAEMRHKVTLKAPDDPKVAAAGTYSAKDQIMMAGKWDVVVDVKVAGKDVAQKKLVLTAK